jgi:hypothetical protein
MATTTTRASIGNDIAGDKASMARATRGIVTNPVATITIVLASAVAAVVFTTATATTITQHCFPQRSHNSGCRYCPALQHHNQTAIAWAMATEAMAMAMRVAGK